MKLYSYVVARDYGFAPNPFYGVCTLATCKPVLRRVASLGDWIVGTGADSQRGYLVYAMKIAECLGFDEYWESERFQRKKPNMRGSKKQAFGDNIYHFVDADWNQLDSHHSCSDGTPNSKNIVNDTKTDRVLIAEEYVYFGGNGPVIPANFRNYCGVDVCARRGHRVNYPSSLVINFVAWIRSLGNEGFVGEPRDWVHSV